MQESIGIEGHPEGIIMWQEDEYWIIKHQPTGVTTQGKSRIHALLMLADALSAYTESDEDLMKLSEDVFIPDEEHLELIEELSQGD